MTEDLGGNEARTTGAGQSVNVVISSGSVKWLVIAVLAFMALMVLTNRTASKAELKADSAKQSSDSSANEFRMTQYWLQRASLACQNGDKLPSIPASLLK